MATNYQLLTTSDTVQVLSPTVVQPVVDATIQTIPSGVVLDYWIDKAAYNEGLGPTLLETVAGNVEHLLSATPAIAATGTQVIDANGLLAQNVTFTVAYQVPGSNVGPATTEVDVPVKDLDQSAIAGENFGLTAAEQLINAAAAGLQALAQG